MPPRLISCAIILFWLGMTAWLIQREVVPMMLADSSPTLQLDLTEQLGSPLVGWKVLRNGERIGSGTSRVVANDDGSFEFRSQFHYERLAIGPARIKSLESFYKVSDEGKLQAILARGTVAVLGGAPIEIGVDGVVENGMLEPRMFGFMEQKLEKVKVERDGSIVNPMHLVNRVRGLREGRTWRIVMLDPLGSAKLPGAKAGQTMQSLIAEVKTGDLTWDKKKIACFVIEYAEPGKEPVARTWVRRSDGLVLQQEASHMGIDLVLERVRN